MTTIVIGLNLHVHIRTTRFVSKTTPASDFGVIALLILSLGAYPLHTLMLRVIKVTVPVLSKNGTATLKGCFSLVLA